MSKRLTLLRHAKSGWGETSEADHERVLSDKGEHHALRLGRLLQEQQLQPDRIVSSSAARAVQTANLICRAMPAADINTDSKLYLASPEALLDVAAAEYDGNNHLMLIAHNPGMTELVNRLSNVALDNLPTCGIFCIDLNIESWSELLEPLNQSGTVFWYHYPALTT